MSANQTASPSAAPLQYAAAAVRAAAQSLGAAAGALAQWFETRRRNAAGLAELRAMTDRELRDVGLTRADVTRIARGAFEPRGAGPGALDHD